MSWKYMDIPVINVFCGDRKYVPIKWLPEFYKNSKWLIVVRVINKSIKQSAEFNQTTFQITVREAGRHEKNWELITCTVHEEKFYDLFEVGKAYFLADVLLKLRTETYDGCEVSFVDQIEFTRTSLLQLCLDPGDNPPLPRAEKVYKFIQIADTVEEAIGSKFDIIGVCTFVEDVDTNCRYKRRKVHLVDESRAVLELWLRGHLSAFDNANNPVMVISNCTTRGPEGLRRVETTPSTSVKINPEIEETRRLKDWFNETGLKNFSSFKKVGAMVDNVNIMVVALK